MWRVISAQHLRAGNLFRLDHYTVDTVSPILEKYRGMQNYRGMQKPSCLATSSKHVQAPFSTFHLTFAWGAESSHHQGVSRAGSVLGVGSLM